MSSPFLFLLLGFLPGGEPVVHEKANPIYRHLRSPGLPVGASQHWPLLAPVLADNLDARAQQAALKKLLGDDIDMDVFLEKMLDAPRLLHRPALKRGDPAAPARAIDLYFIIYGDLHKLADSEILEDLLVNDRRPIKPRRLTREELKKRSIILTDETARQEFYGYREANILVRVQLRAVNRTYWTKNEDSILVACMVDDRFAGDPEFPNQWRQFIKEGEDDPVKEGPPQPYRSGAGYYAKLTRLKEPADALFVEVHLVYTEPRGWFGSDNVLPTKLPAAFKWLARNIRQKVSQLSDK